MAISRRLLLAGVGLSALAPALSSCDSNDSSSMANAQGGGDQNNPPTPVPPPHGGGQPSARVRYDVASEQGAAMLKTYAAAVATMMARPEGDPLSWEFQWYSHWVKGPSDASGKTAEMARIYGSTPSAARNLAQKMWDGCQAHGPNEDEDFFLPWHRMFVWAFENIIRQVSGDQNFTLPYWDYTDSGEFAIPPQFRMQGDQTYGSLYRSARNPGVNAGQPIGDASALNLSSLSEEVYSSNGGDAGFCQGLDNGLHSTVHVLVGTVVGMGDPPWAANDPIFWLHHCNIDRIWASWNAAGHANPSDPNFLNKPFPFSDPTGKEIDYVVASFLDIATVGYSYDQLAGGIQPQPAPRAVTASPSASGAPQAFTSAAPPAPDAPQAEMRMRSVPTPPKATPLVTHASEGITLGRGPVRVQLAQAAAAPDVALRAVQPMLAPAPRLLKRSAAGVPMMMAAPPPRAAAPAPATPAPGPGQHTFLVISDFTTEIQPGVIYSVYLEAPRAGGSAQQYFVGTLSFFSAMGPGMKMNSRKVSFNITELASQLAAEHRLSSTPAVSFVPEGTPSSQSQPLIGSVSLVVQ